MSRVKNTSKTARRRFGGAAVFQVNLSSRSRVYVAPARRALMMLSLLLLCAIAWDLWVFWMIKAEAARLEPAVERLREQDERFVADAKRRGFDLSEARLARLPGEVSFTNRLIAERAFSWTTLLADLEDTVPPGVAIKGIQHDLRESVSIRLTGEGVSLEAVTALILVLVDHPKFYDPLLSNHRVEKKGRRVQFNLTVGYRWRDL